MKKMMILFILSCFIFMGCQQKLEGEELKIKNVFDEQVKALNEKNVDKYMKTLEIDPKDVETTKQSVQTMVQRKDKVEVELRSVESIVFDQNKTKATTEVAILFYGNNYGERKMLQKHSLEKKNNEWKVVKTETIELTGNDNFDKKLKK